MTSAPSPFEGPFIMPTISRLTLASSCYGAVLSQNAEDGYCELIPGMKTLEKFNPIQSEDQLK